MKKVARMTIEEHNEFSEDIKQARRLLVGKRSTISKSYGITHRTTNLIQRVIDTLDKLKRIMDDIYCNEHKVDKSPYLGA